MAAVSLGIGQWARLDTDRFNNDTIDGGTFKTLGLLSRCVSYEVTQDIVEAGTGEPEVSWRLTVGEAEVKTYSVGGAGW